MENTKYNGWTNYATWRINLEMIDADYYRELEDVEDVYELSNIIKESCEEFIDDGSNSLAVNYALAFLSDVNWYEIAEKILSE
jgi:hypothetical protein